MLKPVEGYAVRIARADGSWFFSAAEHGQVTPTWPLSQRKYAVAFRDEMRKHNFNARVVRVHYAHPVEITNGKR